MSAPFRITPVYDLLLRGSDSVPFGLYQLHLVTAEQLTRLHYSPGSLKTIKKRLKELTDNGFILADSVPTRQFKSPYFYALAGKGIRYLKEIGLDVPESVRAANEAPTGYQFIGHALELNDLLISAIRIQTATPRYSLSSFIHERTLKRTPYKATWQGNSYSLIPDAFLDFRLHTAEGQRRLPLVIEHDRGTEEQHHFRRRIHAYLLFIQSQAYVQMFNTRALTVAFTTLKGMKRIEQMREWTRAELALIGTPVNIANVFLFGTLDKPLEPRTVWLEPRWYSLQADTQPFVLLANESA